VVDEPGNSMTDMPPKSRLKKALRTLAPVRLSGIHVVTAALHAVRGRPAQPWALAATQELHTPRTEHLAATRFRK
jgi:hypothetical protein